MQNKLNDLSDFPFISVSLSEDVKPLLTTNTKFVLEKYGLPKVSPSFKFESYSQILNKDSIVEYKGDEYIVIREGRTDDICIKVETNEIVFVPHLVNISSDNELLGEAIFVNSTLEQYLQCLMMFASSKIEQGKIREKLSETNSQSEAEQIRKQLNELFERLKMEMQKIDEFAFDTEAWWSLHLEDLNFMY
ncbi:MAG: SUKH-4 family immunity protein [Bacteroidota bacterium]